MVAPIDTKFCGKVEPVNAPRLQKEGVRLFTKYI